MLQVFALEQANIGSALVHFEPTLLDGVLDACAELRPGGLERVEERRVELLDVDAAVLDGGNAGGELISLRAAASGSA
ncbi:hypothetical protein [Bradyrhizobium sp. B117]|uniref:hypothetical protein n=1 Tax=Bradyrhizobium sp. B117 TaxID=3140246 RepID=UPI003184114C